MKYVKALSLAAVAALAVMALAAGSASATTLCKTGTPEEAVCGSGAGKTKTSATDETITASASGATLTTGSSSTTVVCNSSSTTITATGNSGTSIPGDVTALSFSGCQTQSGISCSNPEVKNLPYEGNVTSTGATTSTLTVADSSGAGAKIVCGGIVSCEFLTEHIELSGENGSPSKFIASEEELPRRKGLFCPSAAFWDATYSVTAPAGLTVLP